jgi:septal ring factor EnvC (AmiA/AmiB activator)
MKTSVLIVTSAFVMSAAVPAFAQSHQQQLACTWTAGNCLDEAKILEKRILQIKNEIANNANNSSEEAKKLEKKLQDATGELKRVERDLVNVSDLRMKSWT